MTNTIHPLSIEELSASIPFYVQKPSGPISLCPFIPSSTVSSDKKFSAMPIAPIVLRDNTCYIVSVLQDLNQYPDILERLSRFTPKNIRQKQLCSTLTDIIELLRSGQKVSSTQVMTLRLLAFQLGFSISSELRAQQDAADFKSWISSELKLINFETAYLVKDKHGKNSLSTQKELRLVQLPLGWDGLAERSVMDLLQGQEIQGGTKAPATLMDKAPKVLPINLLRYKYDRVRQCLVRQRNKINLSPTIELPVFSQELNKVIHIARYHLASSVCYSGTGNYGHYYSIVQRENDSVRCDGTSIRSGTKKAYQEEVARNAYTHTYILDSLEEA